MTKSVDDLLNKLSETERTVRERFEKQEKQTGRVPSTARAPEATRLDQLLLPDEERGRMPFTKGQFIKRENPHRVRWERELRKFLRLLSPSHEHRVAAVHVYEWATGLAIADLVAEEKRAKEEGTYEPTKRGQTSWRADLRHLNRLLKEYFGDPYMTYIMGRKIPRAYRVPKGHYIYAKRPKTLTLYAEWAEGVKL